MYLDPISTQYQNYQDINHNLEKIGFKFGDKGTHTSRTIMLNEISLLLQSYPKKSMRSDYIRAVIEDNYLGKHTLSTRRLSLQRLTELYALDPDVPIFRLMRFFWDADEKAHPLLALLVCLARDPLLRATAPVVISMSAGEEIARQKLTDSLREAASGRLNDEILDKVVRNTASSWTQSGHLIGRSRKKRSKVQPTVISAIFALALGYMLGVRGRVLFDTLFTRVLDMSEDGLVSLAMEAKRIGYLDLKIVGGMTEIQFNAIFSDKEKRLIHGTN